MAQKPLILSVLTIGTPEHPRYVISDQYLRFWEGDGWTAQKDQSGAQLFGSQQSALHKVHDLLVAIHDHFPVRHYSAPLRIDLYSQKPISIRDLQAWLLKSTKIIVDTTNHGNGPIDGSYGAVRLEIADLRERNHEHS